MGVPGGGVFSTVPARVFKVKAAQDTQLDEVTAFEQALALRHPSTSPAQRFEHQGKESSRLADHHSATWRLGGALISTAPAGPSNSITEGNCWRHQRPTHCRKQAGKRW